MRVTKDQSLLTVAATAIRTLPTLAAVLVLSSLSAAAAPEPAPQKISYNRDIRPMLSDNCFFCHGPDQKKRKAKLRLDIREDALAKNAFVPGEPDKSELIRRIFTTDTDDLMPPPASHKTLTLAQKQLFRRWIAQARNIRSIGLTCRPSRPRCHQ